MNTLDTIKERYQQLQASNGSSELTPIERNAFNAFNTMGIPTVKHEEWKYTRISGLFNKAYEFAPGKTLSVLSAKDLEPFRLPGSQEANELVFVNGQYAASLSNIRSSAIVVLPLDDAAEGEFKEIVFNNLGNSSKYVKDGIHAMNTAFVQDGIFIHVKKGKVAEHPLYIYHITDGRSVNILSQPLILMHLAERAEVQVV